LTMPVQMPLPGMSTKWRGRELYGTHITGIAADKEGAIWSSRKYRGKRWARLRTQISRPGSASYLKVCITRSDLGIMSRGYPTLVHYLVANAFHGERPYGCEIHHKNGVAHDNRPENLEYLTPDEHKQTRSGMSTDEDWEGVL